MKKILIVDNRPPQPKPDFSPFPFVIYRESIANISNQEPGEIETAFIHVSNNKEKDWASDNQIKPRFIFGGDIPQPGEVRGIFNLPRGLFYKHIIRFLQHYQDTGRIDPNIFFLAGAPARPEISVEVTREPSYIHFTEALTNVSADTYLIQRTPIGTIDHIRTVEPINLVNAPAALVIEQTYNTELDGLYFAFKLRLSAFLGDISRLPIYLRLRHDIAHILHADPTFSHLLFSPGIYMLGLEQSPGLTISNARNVTPLSLEQHLQFLSSLSLSLPEHKTPHDLTNQWAAFRPFRST